LQPVEKRKGKQRVITGNIVYVHRKSFSEYDRMPHFVPQSGLCWYMNATSNKFQHMTVEARSKTNTKHAEEKRKATTTTQIRKHSKQLCGRDGRGMQATPDNAPTQYANKIGYNRSERS